MKYNKQDKFPGLSTWVVKDTVQRMKRQRDREKDAERNILDEFKEMEELLGVYEPPNFKPEGDYLTGTTIGYIQDGELDWADLVLTNQLVHEGKVTLRDKKLQGMSFDDKCRAFLGLDDDGIKALRLMIMKELEDGNN